MRKLSDQDKQILEGLYQQLRALYWQKGQILTREQFAHATFPVVTDCWGLLGIIKEQTTFQLIPKQGSRGAPYVVRGQG
jgi:hypothetical protein